MDVPQPLPELQDLRERFITLRKHLHLRPTDIVRISRAHRLKVSQAFLSRLESKQTKDVHYEKAVAAYNLLVQQCHSVEPTAPVRDIMTKRILDVRASWLVAHAYRRLEGKGVTHAPYARRGRVYVGVVDVARLVDLARDGSSSQRIRALEKRILLQDNRGKVMPPLHVPATMSVFDARPLLLQAPGALLLVGTARFTEGIVTQHDLLRVRWKPIA